MDAKKSYITVVEAENENGIIERENVFMASLWSYLR